MDSATISALAALAGAAIGGVTSFATSWLTQQGQGRTQQVIHKLTRREELYKDFIEEASPETIVEHADNIGRVIVNTYLAPNKTSDELRDMVNSGAIDLLRDFSEACRKEFERFGYT